MAFKVYKYTVGSLGTNCYFLADPETGEAAVIDPGGEGELLLSSLAEKGLTVKMILLTHAHFDHMMALEMLREATGAPLFLHPADFPLLADGEKNLSLPFSGENLTPEKAEGSLAEGQTLALGSGSITVLHTPGHTEGSVCFLAGEELFSGDTLFRESIGRYDFPGGNYRELMKSAARLAALPGDLHLLPGHGPSSRLSHERIYNSYLQ